ncbi:M18 family aminopeptidase [Clostridia bacterium]|nr:M18 family aminopeptidase [Clostridia bacterium]
MSDTKKSEKIKELEQLLESKRENYGKTVSAEESAESTAFAENFKDFLNKSKTEREAVTTAVAYATGAGFVPFDATATYRPGDKVYAVNRGKAVTLAVFGKRSVAEGVRIIAAHMDAPRIDLKPAPVYEDNGIAYFKTHYYGGIKKYQWTALPLALHGVAVLKNGASVTVSIGESEDEPALVITDLLPHLADKQMNRKAREIIRGEELNAVAATLPYRDGDDAGSVKLNLLNILYNKYGITEADFVSSEFELVPALKARDVGLDRSLVGAYGQDDRVCSYAALMAAAALEVPEYTSVIALTDKEEIGSDGPTGLASRYLEYFINDLSDLDKVAVRKVLSKSECLSADVSAAFDPTFPDVLEKNNAAYLGGGPCLMKYSGSRGKAGTNDADAEFVGKVRSIFDRAGVPFQVCELGKVDEGGGGTVAKYVSALDVNTVDLGVPLLSMHAPFELASKLDIWNTYKAFAAFLRGA